MFYTLSTWAVWMAGAALVGVVVGWLLRSVRPRVVTVIKEVSVDGTPRGSRRPAAAGDPTSAGVAQGEVVSADMVPALLLGETLPSDRTVELERARDEIDALEREIAAWQAEAGRQTERAEKAERYAAAAKADWEAQLEAAHAAAASTGASPVAPRPVVTDPPDVAEVRAERDLLAGEVVTLRAAVQEMRVRLWNAEAQVAALRDGSPGT